MAAPSLWQRSCMPGDSEFITYKKEITSIGTHVYRHGVVNCNTVSEKISYVYTSSEHIVDDNVLLYLKRHFQSTIVSNVLP